MATHRQSDVGAPMGAGQLPLVWDGGWERRRLPVCQLPLHWVASLCLPAAAVATAWLAVQAALPLLPACRPPVWLNDVAHSTATVPLACRLAVGREETLEGFTADPSQLDGVAAVECKGNFVSAAGLSWPAAAAPL